MAKFTRWGLTLSVLLAGSVELRAQEDRAEPLVPLEKSTKEELDQREALRLYAKGMVCQRQDRLLEALKHFERARQLDPKSAMVQRALIPIYLAVGRLSDAIDSCKKVLALDPGDHETWYMYYRQLKEEGLNDEALTALQRAVACQSAKDALDLLLQMNYELGVMHHDRKEYAKAEAAFREVIHIAVDKRDALLDAGPYEPEQLDQETAKTCERLGQVCMQAGWYGKAVAAYRDAQKLAPERAGRLSYHIAEILLAQNKPVEALRQLDQHLETQPAGAEAYELKIKLLQRLRRDNEILPSLERAAGGDEHNVPLHLLLARQYVKEKRFAEGERLYSKLAETTPTQDVYRGLFALYKEQGSSGKILDLVDQTLRAAVAKDDGEEDDEAAVVSPRAAAAAMRARAMLPVLRDDPEMVKAVLAVAKGDLAGGKPRFRNTMRLLAVLAVRTKQIAVAEQLYRACLPPTQQTEAEVYSGLLEVLMEQHKYQEVVDSCKEWRKSAQATSLLLFQVKMAPALVRLGKNDEAIAAMDEAVKLADEGSRLGIHRLRIEIMRQAEQYDRAVKECEALLQEVSRPGQVRDIRYALSNVYSTAQQYAKAEEQLRLILDADPNDATANNDLGYIMADQNKNLEESEKMIRKAIELDLSERKHGKTVGTDGEEANAAYIDSLGWVLFRLGKLPEAKAQLEKASTLSAGEDDPVVWDHLGDVYFRMDDTARARSAWQKALSLYEQEKRRKMDERYSDIKHKLENVAKPNKPR